MGSSLATVFELDTALAPTDPARRSSSVEGRPLSYARQRLHPEARGGQRKPTMLGPLRRGKPLPPLLENKLYSAETSISLRALRERVDRYCFCFMRMVRDMEWARLSGPASCNVVVVAAREYSDGVLENRATPIVGSTLAQVPRALSTFDGGSRCHAQARAVQISPIWREHLSQSNFVQM